MIKIEIFPHYFPISCNFFSFLFPTKNNIKISRWATLYIEFISLNHYVIPYLINDIILDDHFNITKWTFMKKFNHQMEPLYHAFTSQLNGFLILKHFPQEN